jgi:hypothetical protein
MRFPIGPVINSNNISSNTASTASAERAMPLKAFSGSILGRL